MKNLLLAGVITAGVLGWCVAASADVYDWTLSGTDSGSGTLTTGGADGGGYDITGIAGTVDSETITGLLGGDPGPGATLSPSGTIFYDNILYPHDLAELLDFNGVFFDTSGHAEAALFGNGGGSYGFIADNGAGLDVSDFTGDSFTLADTTVPEPASLAVLGVSVVALVMLRGGAGLRLRHRRG